MVTIIHNTEKPYLVHLVKKFHKFYGKATNSYHIQKDFYYNKNKLKIS